MMVGVRSRSLAAAKRSATWAFVPDVCCLGDDVWFAFEAHAPHKEHAAAVTRYVAPNGFPMPTRLGINDRFVCTPRLVVDRNQRLHAVWSAPVEGRYAVFTAEADAQGNWSAERMIWADRDASLRMPAAAFDADNRLWVAAVRSKLKECTVVTRRIEAAPHDAAVNPPEP